MAPDPSDPDNILLQAGPRPPDQECLLVCVNPSPLAVRLVRATQRLAQAQQVRWFALYVETTSSEHLSPQDRELVSETLRLAGHLGGQAIKLSGFRIGDEILQFARENQVTKIFVGKPLKRRWRRFLGGSLVDHLIWNCGAIDVSVISGEGEEARPLKLPVSNPFLLFRDCLLAAGGISLCTGLVWIFFPFLSLTSQMMMYLLTMVMISSAIGRLAAIISSFISVAVVAYFFVPEYFSFAIHPEHVLTLLVMLGVSILISVLTTRIRYQAKVAHEQERQTAAVYEMSQSLTALHGLEDLLQGAAEQTAATFGGQVSVLLPDGQGRLVLKAGDPIPENDISEKIVAGWVFRHGHPAGAGTETLPKVKGVYLPLRTAQQVIGVLRLETGSPDQMLASESLRLLEAMANQVAVAIEREKLLQQAQLAQLQVEAEQMRNALLSTVSHDLRTPLTVIAGSASSLLEGEGHLDSQTKQELVQNIYEEARRLDRLVHNLLEMSRLQSGQATINKEWHVVEEVIGCALLQLDSQLQEHPVAINLAPDLPLIHLDALLMERVFLNLIENVVKYTPKGTAVEISGRLENGHLRLEVRDRGPGLPPGLEEKVFEKFYQVAPSRSRGAGLGLTICRSIVEAHGGRIWAANRPNGGVVFTFIIPLGEASPVLAKRLSDESATVAH